MKTQLWGLQGTCEQAGLHGREAFGAKLWELLAGFFSKAGPSGREGGSRDRGWHQAGGKDGAVGKCHFIMCSSLKKHFMNPSDVPRCPHS